MSYFYAWFTLAISALMILIIGQYSQIDLLVQDYYYDPISKSFPWKNTWFAKDLMHTYLKKLLMCLGFLLYTFLIVDFLKPYKKLSQRLRVRLRFVAAASILIPLTVSLIKKFSSLHCPWDIDRYNGYAPFLRLMDSIPSGLELGACFPGGHATTGLWLASLCVFWIPNKPRKALAVFALGLLLGFIMGWVQQMRGAHFLFHTLWSMWIASLIILILLEYFKSNYSH